MGKVFCLMPDEIKAFKEQLANKEITVEDLLHMSSEKRTETLAKYAGQNAADINLLFERKLVLKNRILGVTNLLSKLLGTDKYTPEKIAEREALLKEYEAQQFERLFNPKENEAYLEKLVEHELGVHASQADAKIVFDLTTKINEAESKFNYDTKQWSSPEAASQYALNKVALEKFVNTLKENPTLKADFKTWWEKVKDDWKGNKYDAVLSVIGDTLKNINDISKSLVASFDNSFLGRQGFKTLIDHPNIWKQAALESNKMIYRALLEKDTTDWAKITPMDAAKFEMYKNPNYVTGEYQKAGIISKREEQFPTSEPGKKSGFKGVDTVLKPARKVFNASEGAFNANALIMRTKLYDLLKASFKDQAGWEEQIPSVGKYIMSGTGSFKAEFGKISQHTQDVLSFPLWAAKMLMGDVDTLTAGSLRPGLTPYVRGLYWKRLGKIVGTQAGLMVLTNALFPDTIETDPRSKNFGMIKLPGKLGQAFGVFADFFGFNSTTRSDGNTYIDTTGGLGKSVVLGSQLSTRSTKSTTTGKIYPLNSGEYGSDTLFDVGINFLSGKVKPGLKPIIDYSKGKTPTGAKPTVVKELEGLTIPITIQNIIDPLFMERLGYSDNPTNTKNSGYNSSSTLKSTKLKSGKLKEIKLK